MKPSNLTYPPVCLKNEGENKTGAGQMKMKSISYSALSSLGIKARNRRFKQRVQDVLFNTGYPDYALALNAFDEVIPIKKKIGATDYRNLYLNENLSDDELSIVARHEILHSLLKHNKRRPKVNFDAGLWNQACDYELSHYYSVYDNNILFSSSMLSTGCYVASVPAFCGLTAHQIYEKMYELRELLAKLRDNNKNEKVNKALRMSGSGSSSSSSPNQQEDNDFDPDDFDPNDIQNGRGNENGEEDDDNSNPTSDTFSFPINQTEDDDDEEEDEDDEIKSQSQSNSSTPNDEEEDESEDAGEDEQDDTDDSQDDNEESVEEVEQKTDEDEDDQDEDDEDGLWDDLAGEDDEESERLLNERIGLALKAGYDTLTEEQKEQMNDSELVEASVGKSGIGTEKEPPQLDEAVRLKYQLKSYFIKQEQVEKLRTYKRPAKKYSNSPFIIKGRSNKYRESKTIACYVDVSGSMSERMVKRALEVVEGLKKIKRLEVKIYYFNTSIHDTFRAGGGTDYPTVLDHAAQNKYSCLAIITDDSWESWGNRKWEFEAIWLIGISPSRGRAYPFERVVEAPGHPATETNYNGEATITCKKFQYNEVLPIR